MSRARPFVIWSACASLMLIGARSSLAAEPNPAQPGAVPSVGIPVENGLAERVAEAARLIQEKSWPTAVRALRDILDSPKEVLFAADRETPEGTITWISGRAEASRLLSTLPADVLAEYRRQAEPAARELLRIAKAKAEPQGFRDVCFRFPLTEASVEATALLANQAVERGDHRAASLMFRKLLEQPEWADRLSSLSLYQAALAFCFSGDKENADRAWKRLRAKVGTTTARVEGRLLRLDELQKEVEQARTIQPSRNEWPIYRGNCSRTAQGQGRTPLLEPSWMNSTLPGKKDQRAWLEAEIKHASTSLEAQKEPLLPASFPIIADGKVLYRSWVGIHAYSLNKEGSLAWYSETDGGLHTLLADPSKKAYLEQWNERYRAHGPQDALFANSLIGTLSTDGKRVFVLDDLSLPPHPSVRPPLGARVPISFGPLTDQVNANSLKAYNLETGKLVWELGGRFARDTEWAQSVFLGVPLPIEGQLYVLTEKNAKLRLICLECKDTSESPRQPTIVWTQTLAVMQQGPQQSFNRRLHCSHLAYRDGVLLCSTNDGAVIGVDLATQRLLWEHRYVAAQKAVDPARAGDGQGLPKLSLTNQWKVSAPAIVDRKVVFTFPDSQHLHCVNLDDGKSQWLLQRGPDDCYFAGVFDGKAVIVGKTAVRAIRIVDGKLAWKLESTGMPSGEGIAAANIYYLPVKAMGTDQEPGICAIDMVKGAVVAHINAGKKDGKSVVLGNLVFDQDRLISQTIDGLACYPLLKEADPSDRKISR